MHLKSLAMPCIKRPEELKAATLYAPLSAPCSFISKEITG
jgi:hypothetical protein